ncbi:MAG: sugar ABC transporter substrate-binding protein [Thermaceae bacterium]|nr:sugar ABC transporter substrate-binding protein [Thermaceae bacterium]
MRLWKLLFISASLVASAAVAQTTLTIATVNNPDMVTMQKLSLEFEKKYPNIKLNWVVLPENELRQKVTTDIATNAGSYDVLTIGTYEAPIWGKNGWLDEMSGLPASYDLEDVLKPVRAGLSYNGKLYALPFYAESSMLMYRKDLFAAKGITVPAQPTWAQATSWAKQLTDPSKGTYGICLRGLPGWGENMAFLTTLINTYGGRWFDEKWNPQVNSPEWKKAIAQYVELVTKYGPPGVTGNGFTENLTLTSDGKCAMWIDATVAAGFLENPKTSKVAGKMGYAKSPVAVTPNGSHWLWSWALGIPKSSKHAAEAKTFIEWATSKDYINLVGSTNGWVSAPPGTRYSTYANPEYLKAAVFAKTTLDSINSADPTKPTLKPVPYVGIQFVAIPEFQAIGTQVGQFIAGIVAGKTSLDDGLNQAQAAVEKTMKEAGYLK